MAFLFIGGIHQVHHLAPVAAALSRDRPDIAVTCCFADAATGDALAEVREAMDAAGLILTSVRPPALGGLAAWLLRRQAVVKGPLLLKLRLMLRRARAIVVPERTSAALRLFGWRRPLIHFRHGAGDRAPKSERRLRAFDRVVVAGEKDVARAVQTQGVPKERVSRSGYVKLDYLARYPASRHRPAFDNPGPVVLYNPHFDPSVSSWPVAREVIARFAAQDRFNLVFAPHIRLAEDMDAAERAEWLALARPGRILVDLDSPRLSDMTYTGMADVYLGDMSSQLYEFLVRPRPAAFINAHMVAWDGLPRYAGWRLGEVADDPADPIPAIERAIAGHDAMIARQEAAVIEAFGEYRGAVDRAARIVAEAAGLQAAPPDGGAGKVIARARR